VKVITYVSMWKMFKPQGVPCKTLRGKPFKTHKINPYDLLHGSIQNILAHQFYKSLFCQNNLEKIGLAF